MSPDTLAVVTAERERCIAVARGCTDYLGGYDGPELEAYHHGMRTVVRALSGPGDDLQTRVLEALGRDTLVTEAELLALRAVERAARERLGDPPRMAPGREGLTNLRMAIAHLDAVRGPVTAPPEVAP